MFILNKAKRTFILIFILTLLIKLWLAAYFPFTGDEAFFYQWGMFPDWGYYDHPPMIGWLLYLLSHISSHPLILRSISVLLWGVIAFGLVDLLKRIRPLQQDNAWYLAAVFLTLPFTWALNLVTTDTPLILFVFCSQYCFVRSQLDGKIIWTLGSGIFLGLAFLSKYFAGLLAVTYAVYFVINFKHKNSLRSLAIIAFSSAPFIAINLGYNATHCYNNIMFNVYNRNQNAHFSWQTVCVYILMIVYLITPWFTFSLLSITTKGKAFRPSAMRSLTYGEQIHCKLKHDVMVLFLVPLLVFFILSFKKLIGLHWVLGFMPSVFLYAGLQLDIELIRKYLRWTILFSIPHLAILSAVIILPLSAWKTFSFYEKIVFHKKTPQIVSELRKNLPKNSLIMATAYTPASILSYAAGEYWGVFGGENKYHARQDDIITDFRQLNGKSIRIHDDHEMKKALFLPYFDSVSVSSFMVAGVRYWFVDGVNFNYMNYRENILKKINRRYYKIPKWLPMKSCPFIEKYDFERQLR